MALRPYQQAAVDAVIRAIKQSLAPIVAELSTGAGKSHIIAAIAKEIHRLSKGKSIIVLCPSKEILEQNREKYLQTGNPASIFSASLGSKCLKHPVVFGTPQSVKNSINKFGNRFAMVIIDECHLITPSVKSIISHIQEHNPMLRIAGVTATPYRMNSGYIYQIDDNNIAVEHAKDPYFSKLVYKITARDLITMEFLTTPKIGEIGTGWYDTSNLNLNKMGKFDSADIDRAFVGHGRKTAAIVADVIAQSRDRKGVMFFAATIQHAKEVLASLPPNLSAIVTGETPKREREKILNDFKNQKIKYIVNVSVLTTGFDATHVDVVAILRATESASLMQQIIGRGLRLHPNKQDCLILDYAENIDRHTPDGDIFNPVITLPKSSDGSIIGKFQCPICKGVNEFAMRLNKEGYKIDADGYFVDLLGAKVTNDEGIPIPGHYGRRCKGLVQQRNGTVEQCSYRWSGKDCVCGYENDIAARYCKSCKNELVDPNEKLKIEFKQLKKDPTKIQIDEVINMDIIPTYSKAGNPCLRVEFTTPYRNFTVWFQQEPKSTQAANEYRMFEANKKNIKTVEYFKEKSGFYKILSYNKEAQECKQIQNTLIKSHL